MKSLTSKIFATLTAATLLSLGAVSGAQADTAATAQTAQLTAFWSEYGVPQAKQNSLIEKIASHKLVDSMKKGHIAVSELTRDRAGLRETVSTYADGSVAVATAELPTVINGVASPLGTQATGVQNCTLQTYSGVAIYSNCHIGYSVGLANFYFTAGFTLVTGAYNDYIASKGTAGTASCVTYCTPPEFQTWKQHEDSSGSAYLTYATEYNLAGQSSATLLLTLEVAGNTYNAHS